MSAEITLTESSFETEVLKSTTPVLIDFWADWCMPCRMIGPIVAQIAEEYAGKLKVCKVNVDAEPGLASTFGIISIPTLVVYKGGKEVRRKTAAMPKPELERLFSDQL